MTRRRRAIPWLMMGMLGCGCTRTPPPVLFHSDAGASAAVDSAVPSTSDASGTDASPPRVALISNAVPGDGTTLAIDGVVLRAESGERFLRYLALDPDGDGDRDVVALRGHTDGTVAGLGYYRREPAAFVSVPLRGSDAPSDVHVTDASLRATSPHSVVMTYAFAPVAPTPDAGVTPLPLRDESLVVELAPVPTVRMRVSDLLPVQGDTVVHSDVDAVDRDGDGHDDAVVTVGARRIGDREDLAARVTVVLLQRGGDYARDTSEPDASWQRLAVAARAQITRRHPTDAIAAIDRLIRLRRALCTEAGAPRVRFGGELGMPCAGASGLTSAAELLARAYLATGEVPAAVALTLPETASELGVVTNSRFGSELRRVAPADPGLIVRSGPRVNVSPAQQTMVHGSLLAFEPPRAPTALTLLTDGSRYDLASLGLAAQPPGAPSDGTTRSPDGARAVAGLFETCDGTAVATCPAQDSACLGGGPPAAVPIVVSDTIGPEHGALCVRNGAAPTPTVRAPFGHVLGWGANGIVVEQRGRLWLVPTNSVAPRTVAAGVALGAGFAAGSSVSASGAYTVVAEHDGLYVRDNAGRWRVWADPRLAGRYRQMTDLAVSDDGRWAAGLLAGQLWVFSHDLPSAVVQANPLLPSDAAP